MALRLTVCRPCVRLKRPPSPSRSIKRQFEAFAAGFKILCDGPAIRLFNACEVRSAALALALLFICTHTACIAAWWPASPPAVSSFLPAASWSCALLLLGPPPG